MRLSFLLIAVHAFFDYAGVHLFRHVSDVPAVAEFALVGRELDLAFFEQFLAVGFGFVLGCIAVLAFAGLASFVALAGHKPVLSALRLYYY